MFPKHYCVCLLMTLAGNCETNVVRDEWSPNCQPPDVVHSLKSSKLHPGTKDSWKQTTGLDHFWGIMANNRGDGRMKKVSRLIFGHWALRRFANSSSQQETLQASPSKLASLPFVKDQEDLTESLLHIRLCSKYVVWILSFKSHDILGTSLVAQWLWLRFPMQGVWVQSLIGELRSRTPCSSAHQT